MGNAYMTVSGTVDPQRVEHGHDWHQILRLPQPFFFDRSLRADCKRRGPRVDLREPDASARRSKLNQTTERLPKLNEWFNSRL